MTLIKDFPLLRIFAALGGGPDPGAEEGDDGADATSPAQQGSVRRIEAGPRQIKSPKIGLTHNMGGIPAVNVVSVCIVGH